MIKINLLPVRLARKKENIRKQLSVYLLSLLFTILIMTYWCISSSYQIRSLTGEVKEVQGEINKYNKMVQEIEKQRKQKDLIQKKLLVLDQLQRSKTGPVHILDEISINLPEKKVWLKSVKQDGKGLMLEGIALDNETIAIYMKGLAASPYFTSVDLVNSAQETVKGIKLMQFTITCGTEVPQPGSVDGKDREKKA